MTARCELEEAMMGQKVVPLFPEKTAQSGGDGEGLPRAWRSAAGPGCCLSQQIEALRDRKKIDAPDGIAPEQIQPASIDLRLGRKAWRVR